jgi:hypothetical protein
MSIPGSSRFKNALRPAAIAGILLSSACAATGGGGKWPSAPIQPAHACSSDAKPVCVEHLGRRVQCSCMDRYDFERFLGQ